MRFGVFCIVLLFGSFAALHSAYSKLPAPPCGVGGSMGYPSPESPPTVEVWHQVDLEKNNWQPPSCAGWSPTSGSKLVVALTGTFRFEGSLEEILARVGAISALRSIRYWSTTDKQWRPLAFDASALSAPNKGARRPDFLTTDFIKNTDLYYWENDSRSGEIVYRLKVHEKTPERAVIATENITPVRKLFVTLFPSGSLQSTIFLQRLSPGVIGIYILSRTGNGASIFAEGHQSSFVNRAAALYRHVAGIKTDKEPPAAP